MASFFVSRVDTEVDRRLEAIGTDEALALRGKAAVANAKLAYQLFRERFAGPRWEALAARGARVQRPLWASTSTKNPDVLRHALRRRRSSGPTPSTRMPEATSRPSTTTARSPAPSTPTRPTAQATLDALAAAGVDLDDVGRMLEDEGVSSFAKSFDELITRSRPSRPRWRSQGLRTTDAAGSGSGASSVSGGPG